MLYHHALTHSVFKPTALFPSWSMPAFRFKAFIHLWNNAYSVFVYKLMVSVGVWERFGAPCFTPYSLISHSSLIASLCPLEIAFNYSRPFSTNTLEMELANKQCQATLILIYCTDPFNALEIRPAVDRHLLLSSADSQQQHRHSKHV